MLSKYVRVKVVIPFGSQDSTGYTYPLNYGTLKDNDKQDVFIMGIEHPVTNFDGRVIAIMTHKSNNKTILIAAPKSSRYIINDIASFIDLEGHFSDYKIECLYESSCGAVVYHDIKGEVRFLLIKNKRSSHWGFPKGHIEINETKEETAIREVYEETGINIKIISGYECISKYKIKDKIEKEVTIFVASTDDIATRIQHEEIEDYIWLTYDRALSLLKFDNDKNIITCAHDFLDENNYI